MSGFAPSAAAARGAPSALANRDDAALAVLTFWAGAIVFVVCLVIGASGGIRGSDQYWYLDDTETLLRGDAPFSNSLYPRQLLVQGLDRSPFIHDILPQRAVLPFAAIFGPYWGWIAMNGLAMLLGAWLLDRALRRTCSRPIAAGAAVSLLLLPLPFLYATQVLTEAAIVPIFAAILLLLQRPGGFVKYTALAIVLTLGLMSRFTVLPMLLLLPVAVFMEPAPLRRRALVAAWTVLLLVVGVTLNRAIFDGIPIPGNALVFGLLSRGFELWYGTEPIVLTMDAVMSKLAWSARGAVEGSIMTRALAAMNWFLMAAAVAGALVAWRRNLRQAACFIVVVLCINVATLAFYLPQVRYVVPSFPVLVYATAILIDGRVSPVRSFRRGAPPLLAAALAAVALVIALKARAEGVRERDDRARVEALTAGLQGDGDVILANGHDLLVAHVLRPRVVLFVPADQPESDWSRILAMPRWRWVICNAEDVARLGDAAGDARLVRTADYRGTSLALLERGSRGAAQPRRRRSRRERRRDDMPSSHPAGLDCLPRSACSHAIPRGHAAFA